MGLINIFACGGEYLPIFGHFFAPKNHEKNMKVGQLGVKTDNPQLFEVLYRKGDFQIIQKKYFGGFILIFSVNITI